MNPKKEIIIYTDGGCLGNPGPGGYGVILSYQDTIKELSGGYRLTTNNRMEIMAAIEGLRALQEKCRVTIYTDSKYVSDSIMKGWAKKWRSNGWRRNKDNMAINPDLWQQLLDLCAFHEVKFLWVKGHSGHPENELCDQLAKEAARQSNLPPDTVYEQTKS